MGTKMNVRQLMMTGSFPLFFKNILVRFWVHTKKQQVFICAVQRQLNDERSANGG